MLHFDLLQYLSFAMIATGVLSFLILLFVPAPYGRNASSTFGPPIPVKLAWIIQELPSLIVPLWLIMRLVLFDAVDYSACAEKIFLLAPFIVHYFQRSLIFPLLIRGGKPTPAVPFLLACLFCAYNGYLQSSYVVNYGQLSWDFASLSGLAIFAFGMAGNIHSDHILRSLRKPGETGYKIPYGGMFTWVSGANFFCEIVEWWGFALMQRSLPALAFALFTMANTAPRAWHHHLWYLKHFGAKYPKDRRAVIPYLI